jgi:hypothetical protein
VTVCECAAAGAAIETAAAAPTRAAKRNRFDLPWAPILGFIDVLAIMFTAVWLAHPAKTGQSQGDARLRFR